MRKGQNISPFAVTSEAWSWSVQADVDIKTEESDSTEGKKMLELQQLKDQEWEAGHTGLCSKGVG